jgi:hypothetical protein
MEIIRLLSVEGQPTKAVSAQSCNAVFFIRAVSDTIFAMLFLRNRSGPPAVHRLQFERQ